MAQKNIIYLFNILILLSLSSCGDFQKPIEVPLPAHTSRLIVESYLEEGKGYSMLLTESTSYFAGATLPNVPNATVIMTYKGRADTLFYNPASLDTLQKIYNYRATNTIVLDTMNDYTLIVQYDLCYL